MTDGWPHYRARITVIDALEAGACWTGVRDFVLLHSGVIAGEYERYRRTGSTDVRGMLCQSARADGDGSGSGYGAEG